MIVFVTSVKEGITDADEKVAKILYRTDKPVILAVNKVDNPELRSEIYDFYSLGFGDPMPLSGTHGIGTGDLLDKVCQAFPSPGRTESARCTDPTANRGGCRSQFGSTGRSRTDSADSEQRRQI